MVAPLRIAYLSPLPPARSGIADYSWELLPYLAARADLTVFSDDPEVDVPEGVALEPLSDFPQARWNHDIALYQMGNSTHHTAIYKTAIRFPGVVVLHDYFLHHFIAHTTTGSGNYAGYARELRYALDEDGFAREKAIRLGHQPPPLFELPLNDRLLDISLGAIVHSDYVAGQIMARKPNAQVAVVPQLVVAHEGRSRRSDMGLDQEVVLFVMAGQVTEAKQLPRVLRAIWALNNRGVPAHLLIVGEVLPEVELAALLAETGTAAHTTTLDFIQSLDEFVNWIATADVVVNLRYPTLGETSSAALRALGQGRPLIVYDHGWYAELPDSVAVKVDPLDDEALTEAMWSLATDPQRRKAMGKVARTYVADTGSPDKVAAAYIDFLRRLQARWLQGG